MSKLKVSTNNKLYVLFIFCYFLYFNFIVVVLPQCLIVVHTKFSIHAGRKLKTIEQPPN